MCITLNSFLSSSRTRSCQDPNSIPCGKWIFAAFQDRANCVLGFTTPLNLLSRWLNPPLYHLWNFPLLAATLICVTVSSPTSILALSLMIIVQAKVFNTIPTEKAAIESIFSSSASAIENEVTYELLKTAVRVRSRLNWVISQQHYAKIEKYNYRLL